MILVKVQVFIFLLFILRFKLSTLYLKIIFLVGINLLYFNHYYFHFISLRHFIIDDHYLHSAYVLNFVYYAHFIIFLHSFDWCCFHFLLVIGWLLEHHHSFLIAFLALMNYFMALLFDHNFWLVNQYLLLSQHS